MHVVVDGVFQSPARAFPNRETRLRIVLHFRIQILTLSLFPIQSCVAGGQVGSRALSFLALHSVCENLVLSHQLIEGFPLGRPESSPGGAGLLRRKDLADGSVGTVCLHFEDIVVGI